MDHRHQGIDSCSPRAQDPGNVRPTINTDYPSAHEKEGPGALGMEAPLHAPSGAGGSGTYLSRSMCDRPGGSGNGMAVSIVLPRDRGMEDAG